MPTLLVQYGAYHCGECLQAIRFDELAERPVGGCGSMLDERGFGVGTCTNSRCDRRGVRLKVPLKLLEVEELPPLEDNPHGAQTTETARVNGTG